MLADSKHAKAANSEHADTPDATHGNIYSI